MEKIAKEEITEDERKARRKAFMVGAVSILLSYTLIMAVSGLEWWLCVLIVFAGWFLGYFIDEFRSRSAKANELR